MRLEVADTAELIEMAGAALSHGGLDELARRVRYRWTPPQICHLLSHEDADVRRLACVILAMCGNERVTGCLTRALRDEDAQVAEMAEQALWSIWFRGGKGGAPQYFRRGLEAMKADELDLAIEYFQCAQQADPEFAEAYNQCGITYYLAAQWTESLQQSEQALRRSPMHFGAMSGAGHSHFQLGNFSEAARWYRRALAINPRMHTVASALSHIERCILAV